MPAILLYFVKLTCSLGFVWLFYRFVLYDLTFYTLNRWYLLGYTLLSFLMPLVNIGPIRGEDPALQPVIIQYIPVSVRRLILHSRQRLLIPFPRTPGTIFCSYSDWAPVFC